MALPVDLMEAKKHLQLDSDAFGADYEVAGMIEDAAAWVETYTGHILEARDVTETLSGFERMELRAWPIMPSTVVGIAYTDSTGAPIGIAAARLDVSSRPARVLPPFGSRWPIVPKGTIVTATFRAGYEKVDDVPRDFRRAMLILIAGYDSDREGGDLAAKSEATAARLCGRHRLRRL